MPLAWRHQFPAFSWWHDFQFCFTLQVPLLKLVLCLTEMWTLMSKLSDQSDFKQSRLLFVCFLAYFAFMNLLWYILLNEEDITASPRHFALGCLREDGTLPRNSSLSLGRRSRIWCPTPVLLQKKQKSRLIVPFCLPEWISGVRQRAALHPAFTGTMLAQGMLCPRTWAEHLQQPGSTRWSARTPAAAGTGPPRSLTFGKRWRMPGGC